MTVYLVWYSPARDNKWFLWGLYDTAEKAQKKTDAIITDYQYDAHWTDEPVE